MSTTKPRHKKVLHAIHTRAEVDAAVGMITDATIALRDTQNQMDAEVKLARDRHQTHIDDLQRLIDEKTDLIALWAQANPAEFEQTRSIVTPHGTIGFRLGNWTLKLLPGITPKIVVEKLKAAGRAFAAYIRVKEEINRESLIGDRVTISLKTQIELGFKIVQDETFFVEPTLTPADDRHQVSLDPMRQAHQAVPEPHRGPVAMR